MSTAPIQPQLDHVSLGVVDVRDGLRRLTRELGGTVILGGSTPGCHFVVTRLGDADCGMNVELIEPCRVEEDPFLVSFLGRRGEGPNHITFVVTGLDQLLEGLAARDLKPVKTRLDDPLWREAFIAPATAGGTVLQLAESARDLSHRPFVEAARAEEHLEEASVAGRGWPDRASAWWAWPGPRGGRQVVLERVVLTSHDLDLPRSLYLELLRGEVVEEGPTALELGWPGGRLRFELDPSRPPGVRRLDCRGLPGSVELAGTRFETIEADQPA